MLDKAAGTVLLFKNFILAVVVGTVLIMAVVMFCTRRFSWSGRSRLVYGWFLNRTRRELVFVGAAYSQLLFVLSAAVTGTDIEPAHLLFLLMLTMFKLAGGQGLLVLIRDLVNSVLMFVSLLVGNILLGYLRETRFNGFVATVLVLLEIFLVLYQGYFFLKDISLTDEKGKG